MSLIRLHSWLLERLDITKMVMVVQKQQNSNIITIPNSFCYHKLVLKSLPGGLPDHALLLAVGVAGHHQDAHGHPGTMKFKQYHHPQQLVSLQLCPKITSWGCPWSSFTLGYWSGWTPPRWSWSSGNILKSLHWWSSTSLINGTLPNNQSPKAERAILV